LLPSDAWNEDLIGMFVELKPISLISCLGQVRLEKQQQTSTELANFLVRHPLVEKVHFVGLCTHEGFGLHTRQSRGPGCVLSFVPSRDCSSEDVVDSLKVFKKTVSFGSVVSVVEIPCLHSHASVPTEHQGSLRFDHRLIRISCGLENASDLTKDLNQALENASRLAKVRRQNKEIRLAEHSHTQPTPYSLSTSRSLHFY
jgi:hypothetical protein